jgi:hypothetical protein
MSEWLIIGWICPRLLSISLSLCDNQDLGIAASSAAADPLTASVWGRRRRLSQVSGERSETKYKEPDDEEKKQLYVMPPIRSAFCQLWEQSVELTWWNACRIREAIKMRPREINLNCFWFQEKEMNGKGLWLSRKKRKKRGNFRKRFFLIIVCIWVGVPQQWDHCALTKSVQNKQEQGRVDRQTPISSLSAWITF